MVFPDFSLSKNQDTIEKISVISADSSDPESRMAGAKGSGRETTR